MAVKFDSTFNLGHVGVIVGVLMTGLGTVYTIKDEMRAAIAEVNKAVGKAESENLLQNQRLDSLDRDRQDAKRADEQFRVEVRQSLTTLSADVQKIIGDIRVITAKSEPRR